MFEYCCLLRLDSSFFVVIQVGNVKDPPMYMPFADDLCDAELLTITSDQGLFPMSVKLIYGGGHTPGCDGQIRAWWFADWNHQVDNVLSGVLSPIAMGHLDTKALHIAKMRYGPKKRQGLWSSQLREAWQVG